MRSAGSKRIIRPKRRKKVAVVMGGGGLKFAAEGGAYKAIAERNSEFEIVSADGVSAGAGLAALAAQNDGALIEAICRGGSLPSDTFPALTDDIHRMRKGSEMLPILWKGLEGIEAVARNDRLWSNYIDRYINEDPASKIFPVYAGVTVWDGDFGRYESLSPADGDWKRIVYGSMTMPPPLWDPVPWQGKLLVDGGLRHILPIDDVQKRIGAGTQPETDIIVAVPTSQLDQKPDPYGGIGNNLLRVISIMTDQNLRADVTPKQFWTCPVAIAWPSWDLGGALESSVELQEKRWQEGYARMNETLDRILSGPASAASLGGLAA